MTNRSWQTKATEGTSAVKVLLVNDDEKFGKFLGTCLQDNAAKQEPLTFVQAGSCARGMMMLAGENWDVVILDQKMMAGQNGLACLKEIRSRYEELPVVMLTGCTTPELAEKYTDAGADEFVRKGLIQTLLPDAIWSATERRRAKLRVAVKTQGRIAELDLIKQRMEDKVGKSDASRLRDTNGPDSLLEDRS